MSNFFLVIIFVVSTTYLIAQNNNQQVISTSGNDHSNNNGKISWTIGETVTETFSNSNNTLTQGFQQSNYLIDDISGKNNNANITVYPNPVDNLINIDIKINEEKLFDINCFDSQSKLVKNKKSGEKKIQIDFSDIVPGSYILKVISEDKNIEKTFKIIKK